MQLGTSLFLIAVGAILTYAVDASVSGIDLKTVGVILMVVGVIGLVLSLFLTSRIFGRRRDVVTERPGVRGRERF